MRRNRRGWVLMTAGALLLAIAIGMAGYNLWDERRAAASVEEVLLRMEELLGTPEEVQGTPERVPDYLLAPRMEMPTVQVDLDRYIGYIQIPALGLVLPVMSEWSYPNLKRAPCRYAGSAYQDNLIICAHNYERHFGGLKNLLPGDEVRFVDIDGNVFVYVVAEVGQLGPYDVQEMRSGDWDLSLFTCTLGGQFRVTVRCEREARA